MSEELRGRTAFVTGAGSGIGRAVAHRLASAGAAVAVVDSDHDTAQEVAESIAAKSGASIAIQADVRSREEVAAAFEATRSAFGVPRVLVTSAGINPDNGRSGILDLSDDDWASVIDVNLKGTFLCCQIGARMLVDSGQSGSLVTISSIGATRATIGYPAYHASKGGVAAFTRSIAVSLAQYGIRANTVAPGYTITPMTKEGLDEPELFRAVHTRIPLGRMGLASEIADATLFLGSDASTYVSGHELVVDGGALALGWMPATIHPEAAAIIEGAVG